MRLKVKYLTLLTCLQLLLSMLKQTRLEKLNITNLATTTALTAVENKIPNVSNLVKKTDYNTKISEIENKITTDHDHDKYITTQEFNKFTSEIFTVRFKQAI